MSSKTCLCRAKFKTLISTHRAMQGTVHVSAKLTGLFTVLYTSQALPEDIREPLVRPHQSSLLPLYWPLSYPSQISCVRQATHPAAFSTVSAPCHSTLLSLSIFHILMLVSDCRSTTLTAQSCWRLCWTLDAGLRQDSWGAQEGSTFAVQRCVFLCGVWC